MVHRVYYSYDLLMDCPAQIEAVESYLFQILLGCSDGSLRIYGPRPSYWSPPSGSRSELRMEPYVQQRNVAGFTKRPFLSMEVLASRELLLTLSGSIAFHTLPNLETVAVLTKARGANACSWDDKRGFLCFARRKRVFIFRHYGGTAFVEVKEFGVPDTVKLMSWCGENICLGIGRVYMIMNATNGALSEVCPCGRLAPPLVVPLPSGELILGKDNIGDIVDQTGKLLPEGRICWSEAPQEVVIHKTFAIGLLPRCVEIRSLRVPYPLIQTVVLPNVRHLAQSSSAIVVAQDNSVCGFFPVPIFRQVAELMASDNYEEALALCEVLPPEDLNRQAAKEWLIHRSYARYLFENERYEEAMDHFLASEDDITYVLALYPSIILPETDFEPEPEKLMFICWDISDLPRGFSGESKEMSHNGLMALIKFLQKKRGSIIETATKVTTLLKERGATIPIISDETDRATILDTALLQALLLTGQSSAAVELLKGLNHCDVNKCEEILRNSSHCTALLELYKIKSMHREALELLHHVVEESKSDESKAGPTQMFKPEMIIEYLKPLCGTDPMLVLEFAMPVLESCPRQSSELFLSGNISADLVNSYLKERGPNMPEKKKVRH